MAVAPNIMSGIAANTVIAATSVMAVHITVDSSITVVVKQHFEPDATIPMR